MAYLNLLLTIPETLAGNQLHNLTDNANGSAAAFSAMGAYFTGIGAGINEISVMKTSAAMVAATGTVVGSTVVATNTVVIGGFTLTAVASGATANQFNVGGTDTLTMAALAAKINGHATLSTYVSAEASGTSVILTAVAPGTIGNGISLAATGGLSISGSATRMAGGSQGTEQTVTVNNY